MRFIILLAALFGLTACGGNGPRAPTVGPLAVQTATSGTDYRLGIGDKVHVTVLGQTDLSGDSEVDAGGKIVVALAGAVDAAGATTAEVADRIRSSLAGRILRDPKIAVQVTEYRAITVSGEVKTPGRYKFTFGIDVRQAIAMAGGYDKRANKDVVIVYRDNNAFDGRIDSALAPGDTVEVARR